MPQQSRYVLDQHAAPPGAAAKPRSEEFLLDVMVRDKKERRVNGPKPENSQMFDNREQKNFISFRCVQGAETVGAGGTRTVLDPLRQIRLVTMIFQCYDTDARRLAYDAAVDLLEGELPQDVCMAVMAIVHKLEVLQPFTNDPLLLRKAIDRATRSQNTDFSEDTEMVGKQLEQMLSPSTGGTLFTRGQISNAGTTLAAQERTADPSARSWRPSTAVRTAGSYGLVRESARREASKPSGLTTRP